MAIVIRTTNLPDGVRTDRQDAVGAELDLAGNPPEGLLFHMAGDVDGEWTITDVWVSRADYDRFTEKRLFPALRKLGFVDPDAPPQARIEEFPVHEYMKP